MIEYPYEVRVGNTSYSYHSIVNAMNRMVSECTVPFSQVSNIQVRNVVRNTVVIEVIKVNDVWEEVTP